MKHILKSEIQFEIQPNNLGPKSIQNIADNFTGHFRSALGLPASGCFRTEPKKAP